MKVMFDGNVYDKLIRDQQAREHVQAAVRAGQLEILTTHVQRDELAQTTDEGHRARLLALHDELSVTVPTSAFVLGVSRLGHARLGSFSGDVTFDGILRTSEVSSKTGMPGRTHDALFTDTAAAEGAVLVTTDRRLSNAAKRAQILAWSYDDFMVRLRQGHL